MSRAVRFCLWRVQNLSHLQDSTIWIYIKALQHTLFALISTRDIFPSRVLLWWWSKLQSRRTHISSGIIKFLVSFVNLFTLCFKSILLSSWFHCKFDIQQFIYLYSRVLSFIVMLKKHTTVYLSTERDKFTSKNREHFCMSGG